jgi:DnaJ-class molecular chaperone
MMHKVDPMEIMLSDIFDKVFYNREPKTSDCEYCDGDGKIEVEVYRPHNCNRDVGVIDLKMVECPDCGGSGQLEYLRDE